MSLESPRGRRKRGLHLYLSEDIVEALERVASESDFSVSRVVEILLGFYWELNGLAEKARFLAEVNRRFRRTT
jgi:lipopolysaccharide biosynthesis regulator YciM